MAAQLLRIAELSVRADDRAAAALPAQRGHRVRRHSCRAVARGDPGAYALAKLKFPGRPILFSLVLLGLCIPVQAPSLPLYIAFAELGILNTYLSMMMPFFLSVFAIFLFRQFFKSYPDEIIQAARLDGVGEFEIVWRIVVPSAWPAIAAFSVFSVVAHWNDLYWPLIVISDTKLATPPLGMMYFADSEIGSNYGALVRRRDHHYGAAGRRVSDRAPALHRRHHHDRHQVITTATKGGSSCCIVETC